MDLPTDAPKQTLASAAYQSVRQAIVDGSLPAGHRLNIRALCDRFAIGLSPVREALSRLSRDGFVMQEDHRGFTVTPLSVEDLDGLLRARVWLNEVGLRESIAHGDAAWEEGVVLAMHRLSRTPRGLAGATAARDPAWEAAHAAFHAILVAACRSDWITEYCGQLFVAAERYRHVARLAGRKRADDESEHRAIAEAAAGRDAPRATRLLRDHFERTGALVRAVLRDGAHAR